LSEKPSFWEKLTKPLRDEGFKNAINSVEEISFSNKSYTFNERFKHIKFCERLLRRKILNYINLDMLAYAYVINGITDYIDDFLCNISTLGLYPNEYPYYYELCKVRNVKVIDVSKDENIKFCDKIAISCPFSYNGKTTFQQHILNNAAEEKVPILLDLAYLGLTKPWQIVLPQANISVAYSFSKHYSLSFDRIGYAFTSKPNNKFNILNQFGYVNISGILKAQKLIENFDIDYIYEKYHVNYLDIIKNTLLDPSECILFGHKNGDKSCITEHYLNTY